MSTAANANRRLTALEVAHVIDIGILIDLEDVVLLGLVELPALIASATLYRPQSVISLTPSMWSNRDELTHDSYTLAAVTCYAR